MKKIAAYILLCFFCLSAFTKELEFSFQGINKKLEANLQETLDSYDYTSYLDSEARLAGLLKQVDTDLLNTLKLAGYQNASIEQFTLKDYERKWQAKWWIELGEPIRIHRLNVGVEGDSTLNPAVTEALQDSGLEEGGVFSQAEYNSLKQSLLSVAEDMGYFEAQMSTHEVKIYRKANQASVDLILRSGPRYSYGNIEFYQTQYTYSPDFLKGFLQFKQGEAYATNNTDTLYEHLTKSGFFDVVQIVPTPNHTNKTVNINIHLQAKKSQLYTVGMGYGTQTGARLLLGTEFRHITETAHHFKGQAQLSENYSEYSLRYVIPGKNPITDSYSVVAIRSFTDVTPYEAYETTLGYDYTRTFTTWKMNLALYQYFAEFTFGNINGHSKYLMPTATITYFDVIKRWRWNQGVNISNMLRGTIRNDTFSDATFLQDKLSARLSLALNQDNRIFVDANAGTTFIEHLDDLAPPIRFYAGGVDSVRGYAFKSLSPKDHTGTLIGGKHLLTFNANLEHAFTDTMSGIVFYDVGQAFTKYSNIHFKEGAGFGLSWNSPVGPLRIYMSKALSLDGDHWRLDLSLGAFL